jgi:hypothetical protein
VNEKSPDESNERALVNNRWNTAGGQTIKRSGLSGRGLLEKEQRWAVGSPLFSGKQTSNPTASTWLRLKERANGRVVDADAKVWTELKEGKIVIHFVLLSLTFVPARRSKVDRPPDRST